MCEYLTCSYSLLYFLCYSAQNRGVWGVFVCVRVCVFDSHVFHINVSLR